MYLKRLEIQGFKSFAGRNVFEFGPGITAVVGPNGSGKSNLADALRWVLGEQNPRVLRSRKSEEVIFGGTRRRPPAGFAEVSIALENADGWLPVGFEEVVITRRLHRSGESEYLINRARVRLRDLQDLLSRGRVGQNSYAIMGQGLVDQVLNLHPEDRRALIEEAADVRRHRVKIQDAVERLNATRENLDRVGLLVGEIGPRLQQLESQALRAAEHAALSASLAETLHALFSSQWRERNAALMQARAEYETRMQALLAAQDAAQRADVELAATRETLQQQRQRAAASESATRDLEERLRRTQQRLQLLAERRTMLEGRIAELGADIESLGREQAELERETAGPAGALPDRAALEQTVAARRAELQAMDEQSGEAVRAAAQAEDELRQARGQVSGVEERAQRLQRSLRTLDRETEELAGRRNGLLARLRKHGSNTLHVGRELRTVEAELQARSADLGAARRQVQLAREAAERAETAARDAARDLEAARARYELLARLHEEHLGSNGGLNAIADAAERSGRDAPPRLLAILGQVLRVQKGLETAIEAALEGQLHTVIVPGAPDLDAALTALQRSRAGRASVVALSELKPSHALNLSGERGVVGVAARLIKCDARYRDLVDTLLGRVIVVEDLNTARSVLRRGLGTVVTLDGVLLRPSGLVTAGRAGAAGLAFGYAQELEALPGTVAELRAAASARTEEQARARDHVRAAEARLRELERTVDTLQAQARRDREELSAARAGIANLRGEAIFIRSTAGSLQERRLALQRELVEIEDERRRQAQFLRNAQLTVEDARRGLEQARRPVEERRAALAEAEAALAALRQQDAALAGVRESRRQALERTLRTLAVRRADEVARQLDLRAVHDEDAARHEEEAALAAELKQARTVLQPLREQLSALTQQERAQSDALMARRAEALAAERASMEAESNVSRRAQSIERLREEMEAEGYDLPDEIAEAVPAQALLRAADAATQPPDTGQAVRAPAGAAELQSRVRSLRAKIRQLGPVNAQAETDYREAKERYEFLTAQVNDLQQAEASLQEALGELRRVVRERFRETFHAANAEFGRYFRTFFGGGSARLVLTEPEDYGESGVDVLAQPPGKRQQHLQLLSGGERSMTAVALLFALLETNPAPFCVLDEVDAALDEANVGRFAEALGQLDGRTQFVLITHNRHTIQAARTIYGVSMGGDGASSVLSLRLEDVAAGA